MGRFLKNSSKSKKVFLLSSFLENIQLHVREWKRSHFLRVIEQHTDFFDICDFIPKPKMHPGPFFTAPVESSPVGTPQKEGRRARKPPPTIPPYKKAEVGIVGFAIARWLLANWEDLFFYSTLTDRQLFLWRAYIRVSSFSPLSPSLPRLDCLL